MSEIITIDTGNSSASYEPYSLVAEQGAILSKPTEIFDFSVDTNAVELAGRLVETVKLHRAYGLAAPQCGISSRVFVMGAENDYIVVFNPEIISSSSKSLHMEEGCLSFPFLVLSITRPEEIEVKYQNENGDTINRIFGGISARIFQHELDHLNGITFDKVAKSMAFRMGMKKREKQIKKFARNLIQQRRYESAKSS